MMRKALLVLVLLISVIFSCNINKSNQSTGATGETKIEYGIPVHDMLVKKIILKEKDSLKYLMNGFIVNIHPQELSKIDIKPGAKYTLIATKDSILKYVVCEPSRVNYTIFDMEDLQNIAVNTVNREIRDVENVKSLFVTDMVMELVYGDTTIEKFSLLAEVFDYYEVQPGDKIVVAYDQKYADDKFLYINKIKAIKIENKEQDNIAFLFEENGEMKYVTEDGRNVQPRFIKAPLKYKRISSRFSLTRKHPVTKRVKPHYGTDFAAPTGTPIWSTAEGVVVKKGYSRGNGNYIVIKHDEVYSTQYLHMSKFAKGIRRGSKVEKGQVIGYVGKTGLASGPHLCYRFWVNGVQVDPLSNKELLHEKLASESLSEFKKVKKELEGYFSSIAI